MFKKKFRLLAAMLLSVFTLIAVGVFTSFLKYDREKIFINSMYDANNYYLPLIRDKFIDDDEIAKLDAQLPDHSIIKNYKLSNGVINLNQISNYNEGHSETLYGNYSSFNNILELDENIAKDFKLKLLAGKYPSNDNEIVITEYIFTCFKKKGYLDLETESAFQINTYSDLIGKKLGTTELYLQNGGFIITGIVDTKFDYKKYERIFNNSKILAGELIYNDEPRVNGIFGGSMHRTLFLNKGFNKRFLDKMNLNQTLFYSPFTNRRPKIWTNDVPNSGFWESQEGVRYLPSISKVGNIPYRKLNPNADYINIDYPFGIYWKDNIIKPNLSEKEIIVCFENLIGLKTKDDTSVKELYDEELNKIIELFVTNNFDSVKSQMELYFNRIVDQEDYIEYILECDQENIFQNGYNLQYFQLQAQEILSIQFLNGLLDEAEIRQDSIDFAYRETAKIVGIYTLGSSKDYFYYPTTFVSDVIYSDFATNNIYPSNFELYINLTGNFKKDYMLIKKLNIYNEYGEMIISNQSTNQVYIKNSILNSVLSFEIILSRLSIVFIILAILLLIISFILIFNYFSSSIVDEYKKIGIIRAIGASKRDIFNIYYSRSLIIMLFGAIISIIGSFLAITLANAILSSNFYLTFTILTFDNIQPAIILLFCFLSITLASIIPIASISRKPLVKLIQNL